MVSTNAARRHGSDRSQLQVQAVRGTRIQVLLRRAEIDRAVIYGILQRIWQVGSGPITSLAIAIYFTPVLQGFYFTFFSLLAVQTGVEMGMTQVIIQFASHEWAHLKCDDEGRIVGDSDALSRLTSLAHFAFYWYSVVAVLILFGLSVAGYLFFAHSPTTDVHWAKPWFALCFLTSLMVLLAPWLALLEGCNQVAQTYQYRFIVGLINSVALWVAIVAGAGLWTPAIALATRFIYFVWFIRRRYVNFFAAFLSRPTGPTIAWRKEIWGLQWRFAISWASNYLCLWGFTPIAFHNLGVVTAGQVGMTINAAGAVSGIATTWVATKAPVFGIYVARREYRALDRLMIRSSLMALGVAASGAVAVWGIVCVLNLLKHPLAARLLPPTATGLFMVADVLTRVVFAESVYLRAHKQEPFVAVFPVSAILVTASSWFFSRHFGVTAMGAGYLAAMALAVMPLATIITLRCRAAWHAG
jgi:hypothetical protein